MRSSRRPRWSSASAAVRPRGGQRSRRRRRRRRRSLLLLRRRQRLRRSLRSLLQLLRLLLSPPRPPLPFLPRPRPRPSRSPRCCPCRRRAWGGSQARTRTLCSAPRSTKGSKVRRVGEEGFFKKKKIFFRSLEEIDAQKKLPLALPPLQRPPSTRSTATPSASPSSPPPEASPEPSPAPPRRPSTASASSARWAAPARGSGWACAARCG